MIPGLAAPPVSAMVQPELLLLWSLIGAQRFLEGFYCGGDVSSWSRSRCFATALVMKCVFQRSVSARPPAALTSLGWRRLQMMKVTWLPHMFTVCFKVTEDFVGQWSVVRRSAFQPEDRGLDLSPCVLETLNPELSLCLRCYGSGFG